MRHAVESSQGMSVAIAKQRVIQKAVIAVARKLAIILQRMWRDETGFRWTTAKG